MLFDRADLCLRNFNSTIPVDAIRVKSYVDSFVDRSSAPVRISINKLDLVPNQIVGVFRNGGGLDTSGSYIPSSESYIVQKQYIITVTIHYSQKPNAY